MLGLSDIFENYFVSPTLLRVIRVFRVGRVLRLVKSAKGIRTLLFSLAVSLPALFNIGLLLFLVMFIYAILGMSFFMNVKHTGGLDDMMNFETFGRSVIILFQISTSAGWDGALAGLMNIEDCETVNGIDNCGSHGMAILYLVTYLVITFLVVINMYIAVILENFSQATEDVQQGLTQDDFDMYYEIWEKYDEEATQYIPLKKLSDFVSELEEPLQLPHPNYFKLVNMDIPICEGDTVHCVDILDALTKHYLGTGGDEAADLGDIKKGPERPNYVPLTSTRRRQREIICARVVQSAWRDLVARKGGTSREDAENAAREYHKAKEPTDDPEGEGDGTAQGQEGKKGGDGKGGTTTTEADVHADGTTAGAANDTDNGDKVQCNGGKKDDEASGNNKDEDKKDDDDDNDAGGRTVELFPESGVVA